MIEPPSPMCALNRRYPVLKSSVTKFVGRAGVPVQTPQANLLNFESGWDTWTDGSAD